MFNLVITEHNRGSTGEPRLGLVLHMSMLFAPLPRRTRGVPYGYRNPHPIFNLKNFNPPQVIDPRTVIAERKNKLDMDTRTLPRIGDKVYFEVNDELHENKVRVVHAKIIRQYPKKRGNCCEYLAFDCVDLDHKDIYYTVPYDEEFIKTDTG